MRLSQLLEEWKKQEADIQGVEGKTYKLTKETPHKETRYEKVPSRAYNFETLLSELNARDIVNMANIAFKAFGYKTDLLSVPALFKYKITYPPGDSTFEVIITTSSFNSVSNNHDVQKEKLWRLVGEKALLLNFLIQNNDMHLSNFVKHQKTMKNYAIDFGMAFTDSGRGDVNVTIQTLEMARQQILENHPDKLERYAKYLTFWQGFLEQNMNPMLAVFNRNMEKILKEIKDSKAPSNIINETAEGITSYTMKTKAYFRAHAELLKKFVDATIKMVEKEHNKFTKGE